MKKGLSSIISTVLLVLITVVSIGVVAVVVLNSGQNSLDQISENTDLLLEEIRDGKTNNCTQQNTISKKIILGDYNSELRTNSRVNISLNIERLEQVNANTYAFLLYHYPDTDWEDFLLFLNATKGTGIDVYAYLVPPSENCAVILPYRCDFNSWARELANLSLQYKHLKGWIIDDFYEYNFFTESYVREFTCTAKSINPEFGFYPIIYYWHFSKPLNIFNLLPYLDGIVFPFFSVDPVCNHNSTIELEPEINLFNAIYNTNSTILTANYPYNTISSIGDSVNFTSELDLSKLNNFMFEFYVFNPYSYNTTGYHFAQMLVNNDLFWEDDLGNYQYNRPVYLSKIFDLSDYISLEKINLTFRVVDKARVSNYPVNFSFIIPVSDWEISVTGKNFTGSILNIPDSNLSLIVMSYASPLTRCGLSSPEYVGNVTRIALEMALQGKTKGVIQYALPKSNTSSGTIFDTVRQIYEEYSQKNETVNIC